MKDKIRYKNKIRKKQLAKTESEQMIIEDDSGVLDDSFNRLKDKVSKISGFEHDLIIQDSSQEKMSEVLLEYGEPFLDSIDPQDRAEHEKAIQLSMMLWNCAIMQDDPKKRKEVKKTLKALISDAESKSVVLHMLDRKRLMFPNNKRIIVSYELTETQRGFHLHVVSTPPSDE